MVGIGSDPIITQANRFIHMISEINLTNLFFDLVQIDSPTGHEDAVVAFIEKKLAEKGIQYKVDSYGNIIAYVQGKSNETILLTAHMDTVEPGRGISPFINNGVIKSSGETILGADNKAGVAAILEAVLSFEDIPENSLEIVFTRSEEVGNLGAVNLDYRLLRSKVGFSFDTGGKIGNLVVASPFYLRFDFSILGKSAHAGKPEEATNVLPIFSEAMQKITLGKNSENTLCNIGIVHSGDARNTVPGALSLQGEVRSYSKPELEETYNRVKEVFESACTFHEATLEHSFEIENPGFTFSDQDNVVQYGQKIARLCGIEPNLIKATGCYDANVFYEKGIQVLNFSNGGYANHTVNEEITVKDLYATACFVEKILQVGYINTP